MFSTHSKHRILCILLTVIMFFSCLVFAGPLEVSADSSDIYFGKVKDICLNGNGGLVLKENGELWIWPTDRSTVPIKIMDNVVSMSSGRTSTNALATTTIICEDGSLWVYGTTRLEDDNGSTISASRSPYHVMDDVAYAEVCPQSGSANNTGGGYVAVIKKDGSLYMWGSTGCGVLGDGNIHRQPYHVMDDVASVALGKQVACAIKTNGELWTWGCDYRGSLGQGTTNDSTSEIAPPKKILDDVVSVDICSYDREAAGAALQSDGTLLTWGANKNYALGNTEFNHQAGGAEGYIASPQPIMGNIASVTCNHIDTFSMAAITKDGTLYIWGAATRAVDPEIALGNVSQALICKNDKYAIRTNGDLYAWGGNSYGELGVGSTNSISNPAYIMSNVSKVCTNYDYTMALQTNGKLWIWGDNKYKQLGDGTTESKYFPVDRSDSGEQIGQEVYLVDENREFLQKDSYEYNCLIHLAFAKFAYNNNKSVETITSEEVSQKPTVAELIKNRTRYTSSRYYTDPLWKTNDTITNRAFYNAFVGDWTLVKKRFKNDGNGFCAYAFLSPEEDHIIISYTGSQGLIENGSIGSDWDTDFWFALGSELKGQFADATKFYDQVRKAYPNCKITFTGHSLGGALAAYEGYRTGLQVYAFDGAVGHISFLTMYRMSKEVRGFKGVNSDRVLNLTDEPQYIVDPDTPIIGDEYLSIADAIQNWKIDSYVSEWYETGADEVYEDDGSMASMSFEQGGYKHKIWTCLTPVEENMISFNSHTRYVRIKYVSQDIHFSNAAADLIKGYFDNGDAGESQRTSYVSQNTLLKGRVMLGTTGADKISAPSLFIVDSTPGIRRNTTIFGGDGSDKLTGYTSNDTLVPGNGENEKLDGQLGNDWYIIDPCPGQSVTIKDAGGKNNIVLRDFSPSDITVRGTTISLPKGQTVSFKQSGWDDLFSSFKIYYQTSDDELIRFDKSSAKSAEQLSSSSKDGAPEGMKMLEISGTGTLEVVDGNGQVVCSINNLEASSESIYEEDYGYFYAFNDENGQKLMAFTPAEYSVRLTGNADVALISADVDENGISHSELYENVALSGAPVVQVDENGAHLIQENPSGDAPLDGGTVITGPQTIEAPEEIILLENETTQIGARILPLDAASAGLVYTVENEDIATVSSDGTVTASAKGSTWIYIRAAENEEIETAVALTVRSEKPEPAYDLTFNKESTNIAVFDSEQLTVSYTLEDEDDDAPVLTWSSSNKKVAVVDQNGVITTKAAGKAVITVTAEDGLSKASCDVRVTFRDVPLTHSFQKAVYWGLDNGITAGYNDSTGKFGVNDPVTRGQVVMFLWRAAGKPNPRKNTQTFKDVPTTHNFYKAIQWASEQKITGGYSGAREGYFGPSDKCTRGQIAMFMWRYAGKQTPAGSGQTFKDVPVTHNFYKAIQWAAEKKITIGYTSGPNAGCFGINDTCTRGQCITFLYRLMHLH